MTEFSDRFIFVLIDAAVKATVILGLAAIVAWLSRRASASFRHLIWALGLGCVLFLPLFSQTLPQWHVAVKTPALHWKQEQPLPLPVPSTFKPKGDTTNSIPTHALPFATRVPSTIEPSAIPPSPTSVPASPPGPPTISWTIWAFVIWAGVALLVMIKLARSLLCLKAIAKASVRVHEGFLNDAKSAAMKIVGLDRPVTLRLSSDTTALSVPITCGTLRPVIVFPTQATEWSQDKLHAALLHELAHVRRSDWLLQTLARVACALQWFNPMVWFVARRMRAESETACDDLVLAAGVPAPDYARHLLDIALQARNGRRISAGAVAMAQSPQIEGRLRTVLATGLRRGSVGRRMASGIIVTAFLLALPLAALRVAALVTRVPVPAADQLQLHGDFTLVYAVTIRNKQTQAILLREYQQLHQDYQKELKQNPYFQPVPEDFYLPFATYQRQHTRTRHVVTTIASRGNRLLYQTVEDGDSYSQVYDGHDTQTFGNGHAGSSRLGEPFGMQSCPLPAVGLPYIPLLKNATFLPSGGHQTWHASILDVGATQGQNQLFYVDGNVHAVSDNGTWKVLDTDNSEQQWQFLQHQRFQGLWLASHMRFIEYDFDGPLLPKGTFKTVEALMDWGKTMRRPNSVCEFRLLSASDTPFDPAALVKREPPRVAAASWLKILDDFTVQEALHLRYHLQNWAESNKALLQQMGKAGPADKTFAEKVDRSLGTLPFPLWQGGGVMWDGDPRVGHDGQKPWFAAEHLGQQIEGTFRDFEIARSPKNGFSYIVLWASGRITRNTLSKTTATESQQEIVSAFYGEDGTSNMADTSPVAASNTSNPPELQQPKFAYGFRRYISPPLPDGTRFTFLYPSYYNNVSSDYSKSSQEYDTENREYWSAEISSSGVQPVRWAAARGQEPIPFFVRGSYGMLLQPIYDDFCSIVVGHAGNVLFPTGAVTVRKDTHWAGKGTSHHTVSILDKRTHLRFLVNYENRDAPDLFRQVDPVIFSSFRILPPTRGNQSKNNWTKVRDVPLQPSTLTKAAPAVSKTANSETDTAAGHIALGQKIVQNAQYRDAIPEFRRAVQIEPNNDDAQYSLADALFNIKTKRIMTPQGAEHYFFSTPPAILDEAILHMQKAVALQPQNMWWHSELGTYLSNRGRDAEAIPEFRRALQMLPPVQPSDLFHRYADARFVAAYRTFLVQSYLANSLLKVRHYQEAIIYYQKALMFHSPSGDPLHGVDNDLLLGYGDALQGAGRHAESKLAWKRVVANSGAKNYYGRRVVERLAEYR